MFAGTSTGELSARILDTTGEGDNLQFPGEQIRSCCRFNLQFRLEKSVISTTRVSDFRGDPREIGCICQQEKLTWSCLESGKDLV